MGKEFQILLERMDRKRKEIYVSPINSTSDADCQRGWDEAFNFIEDQIHDINEDMNSTDPNHYKQGSMETIDEMILIFGKEAVIDFCKVNAWKYRARAIYKNGEEDMAKSDWYLEKAKELSE